MINDMEILLIGGTGVLSAAVAKEALRQGFGVTMINRGRRASRVPAGAALIKADKNDRQAIGKALEGRRFDAVMDFLCYTAPELASSFSLYSAHTGQYFFISSCAVYKTSEGAFCDEDAPKPEPAWPYSVRKWECERLLMRLAAEKGAGYTIVRPAVTYDDTRIPYGISPRYGYHWTLAARVLAGKPVITWNKGMNYCCMMRAEDFAAGVVGLVGNPLAVNEAFNVCGDEAPTFRDVLDAVSDYLGRPVRTADIPAGLYAKRMPERAGEILAGRAVSVVCGNSKIKKAVPGFRQTVSLKDGVRMTLDAYRSQNYQCGIDWTFDGRTDRIISKYMKTSSISLPYRGYEDYLGNATAADRAAYYAARYTPERAVCALRASRRLLARLARRLRGVTIPRKG